MTRRESKARFKALRSEITRALNEADPIELIKDGAPADEYSPEIGTIIPRLNEASSESALSRIIHEEFSQWFGVDVAGPEERFDKATKLIWSVVSSTVSRMG